MGLADLQDSWTIPTIPTIPLWRATEWLDSGLACHCASRIRFAIGSLSLVDCAHLFPTHETLELSKLKHWGASGIKALVAGWKFEVCSLGCGSLSSIYFGMAIYRILSHSLESLWRFHMHTNMHVSMPTYVVGDCRCTKVLAVLLRSERHLRETLQSLTGQLPRRWGTGYKGEPAATMESF